MTRKPRPDAWMPWAVAVTAALPFLPALRGRFLGIDDNVNFVMNSSFRGLGPTNLKWMFFSFQLGGVYQPLSWVTHGLDYMLWGMDPWGYHLSNVLLMSACAAAFYFLARRFLRLAFPRAGETELALSAAFAALAFSLHPQRAEVVAWVSNRSYLLPGLFYILALDAYLKARAPDARRRGLGPCALFFALSLMSKAIAMTLPLTLLVLDYYPLGRLRSAKSLPSLIKEKLPLFALSLAAALVALYGRRFHGALPSIARVGVTLRLAKALYGPIFYLEKALWPSGLAPTYVLSSAQTPLDARCLPRTLAFSALSALAVWQRRRRPWIAAAWCAHLIALLPFLGVVYYGAMQIAADKWFFLASCVWALGAAALALWLSRRAPPVAITAPAAAALVFLGAAASAQARLWRDTPTILGHNLAVQPRCYSCYGTLAYERDEQGDHQGALDLALKALALEPKYTPALFSAAQSYDALGDYEKALEMNMRLVGATGGEAKAYVHLAEFLGRHGKIDSAVEMARKSVELAPDLAIARRNLGVFLYQAGRRAEAAEQIAAWARLEPGNPEAARALEAVGRP